MIVWPILMILTVGLVVLELVASDVYKADINTHVVNATAAVLFFLIWLFVRKFIIFSWFVCPLLTAFIYYYFAVVDYDGSVVSIYYTLIVGITSTFFILVVFSESWMLSSVVYAPLLAFYMKKTGDDMIVDIAGDELNELIIRCVFCVFLYAIVAYKVEALNK